MLRAGGYRALSLDEVARRRDGEVVDLPEMGFEGGAGGGDRESGSCGPAATRWPRFQLLMNGPMGGVVTSLDRRGAGKRGTRSIVIELLGPYRRKR